MAGPEQQIAAPDRVGLGEGRHLHVTVAGAGDGTGQKRGLRQPRTVDAPAAVAAPQVRRAKQAFRHRTRVAGRAVRDMLRRHPAALRQFGKPVAKAKNRQPRAKGQAADFMRFEIGLGIDMRGRGRDAMRDHRQVAGQRLRRNPAAVTVGLGLDKGPTLGPVDHQKVGAEIQLPVAGAARGAAKIGHGHAKSRRRAGGIVRALQTVAPACQSDAVGRGGQAAVAHSRIPGRAFSRARMPCPAPPLGRPGAAEGCQP